MAGSRYTGRNQLLKLRIAISLLALVALTACDAAADPLTDEPSPTAEPTLAITDAPASTFTPVTADTAWVDAESYAVYQALFDGEQVFFSDVESIFLDPMSIPQAIGYNPVWHEFEPVEEEESPELAQSTYDHFYAVNDQSYSIENRFGSDIDVTLISWDQFFKTYFPNPDYDLDQHWADFYEAFPNSRGFFSLSRVGFSDDGTQALVYYEQECGSLCGVGEYVLLQKIEGRWIVIGVKGVWIS